MTPRDIELVQSSFAKVAPIAETAAELFYARLFELDPSVKPLFKTDLKEQGKRLMSMIATAVNGLNDVESLVPAVQDMGRRHIKYGVTRAQYGTVGQALLDTLAKGLGDDFTPEVKNAWTVIYGVLSTTMIAASYDEVGEPLAEQKTA